MPMIAKGMPLSEDMKRLFADWGTFKGIIAEFEGGMRLTFTLTQVRA